MSLYRPTPFDCDHLSLNSTRTGVWLRFLLRQTAQDYHAIENIAYNAAAFAQRDKAKFETMLNIPDDVSEI